MCSENATGRKEFFRKLNFTLDKAKEVCYLEFRNANQGR